jgi:hypothetical protein
MHTFEKYQIFYAYRALEALMPTLIFRCPTTGQNVRCWLMMFPRTTARPTSLSRAPHAAARIS